MKTLFYLAAFFCLTSCNQQQVSEISDTNVLSEDENKKTEYFWMKNKIDSANLYVYFPEPLLEEYSRITELYIVRGKQDLNPYIIDELTRSLNREQIEELQNRLVDTSESVNQGSGCFNPHHGIIMWNENKDLIGHITICVGCENFHYFPSVEREIEVSYFIKLIEAFNLPMHAREIEQYVKDSNLGEFNE